jgi:hypothetical protein
MTSSKARLLPQVIFIEVEGVNTITAEALEEHHAWDAG